MLSSWVEILLPIQVIAVPSTFNLSHATCRVSHILGHIMFRACHATQRDKQINEFLYYKIQETISNMAS